MEKLCRGLENKIGIHTNISYFIFGQQRVNTPDMKIALSLFLTSFGITFMMITAGKELLFALTCV